MWKRLEVSEESHGTSSVGISNEDIVDNNYDLETDSSVVCEDPDEVLMNIVPKSQQNTDECNSAKEVELQKLVNFQTYDEVDAPEDHEVISTTWVIWQKGQDIRARLVAHGF